ncbi:MAG: hypothetical protein JJE53_00555 [Candidatus Pacebacteria bacterium]|nr:hypothetical protein [Candidatus Paceibacterota bacterium]
MRKIVFLTVAVMAFMISSCGNQPSSKVVTTTTTTKTSISDMNGFTIKTKVVVKGETVWGYSEKEYGTGFKWREIIAMNPFLNAPGRIYFNPERKQWIVIIYPGEVVKIGNEILIPSYTVEETVTTTTSTPIKSDSGIPWWGWLLIGALIAFVVWLIDYYQKNNKVEISSSTAVHIAIHNGGNIDLATRATLLGREQDFQDHALDILSDSAKKNQLSRLFIEKNENLFVMSAKFFNHGVEKPAPAPVVEEQKTEPLKEEGK